MQFDKQLHKLQMEHELVDKITRLCLTIGSVILILIAAWRLI